MEPRSDRAADTVANLGDARILTRVDILIDGVVQDVPASIVGGQVQVDATADIARSCSLELKIAATPAEARQWFIPGVTEVAPYRGFLWPDGTSELAPLGVFGISTAPISSGSGVRASVTAFDRARAYQRAGVITATRLRPGTALEDAIGDLLRDRVARIPQDLPATGVTLNSWTLIDIGDDPWQAARDVAASFGWDVYLDMTGTLSMRSLNAVSDPVAAYGPAAVHAMLDAEVEPTDVDVYSGVIVVGTGPDLSSPVRGEAWDLDPDSPTYSLGPFGQIPLVVRSEQVSTVAQATGTAESMLADVTGVSEPMTWTQLVDPWLDARDVLTITRPELGVSRDYRLETLTIPLVPSVSMSATGKAVQRWT